MLLALDVGNTEITIGVFDGDKLVQHWRVATVAERTADEHALSARPCARWSGATAASSR